MNLLHQTKEYGKTMLVSGLGALMSLLVTAFLTEFVLGRERYFTAYLVGVAVATVFAFVTLSRRVFHTEGRRLVRFVLFSLYMVILVIIQTVTVKTLVSVFGTNWYLPVIAGTIGAVSVVSYLVYKFIIFR